MHKAGVPIQSDPTNNVARYRDERRRIDRPDDRNGARRILPQGIHEWPGQSGEVAGFGLPHVPADIISPNIAIEARRSRSGGEGTESTDSCVALTWPVGWSRADRVARPATLFRRGRSSSTPPPVHHRFPPTSRRPRAPWIRRGATPRQTGVLARPRAALRGE
jgi:hypothetical protein